jgi:hypothetical protein
MAVVVPIISTFDARGINKAITDFKNLDKAGSKSAFALLNTNKAVNTLGKNFAKFGGIAAGVASVVGGSLAAAAYESQKVMKQTEAIIAATGTSAGLTAKGVADLAESMSMKTGLDDEAIQTSMNLLLTFKQVRNEMGEGNDIFNRASMAMLDLGNVFGSTDAAAKMLGKALSDPVRGVTALARAGVNFSKQQRDQIKTLVATGKTLDAQKLILAEVESQVGGTAVASATAFDKMKVAVGNVQENLGGLLLPVIERLSNFVISSVVPTMNQFVDIVGKDGLGAAFNYLTGSIIRGVWNMGAMGKTITVIAGLFGALKVAVITYTVVQTTLGIAAKVTTGALLVQIQALNATRIAMLAAGGVTALLAIAGTMYALYAANKSKAVTATETFTDALFTESNAQRQAMAELATSDPVFAQLLKLSNAYGLSVADLQQYLTTGTGKFSDFAVILGAAAAATGTLTDNQQMLGQKFVLAAQAAGIQGQELDNVFFKLQALNVQGFASRDVATTLKALGLEAGGAGKQVETAAQKFTKFADSARAVVADQKNLRSALKNTSDAQKSLQTATDNVASAQAKLNKIASGYGASSKEAAEAQSTLAAAQRDATRAGFALADAQSEVLAAQRKIADLNKAADPRTIQEAQDDLTQAQYSLVDAEEELAKARRSGNQRDIVEAEIAVRDATNGVTDANTKLVESQKAADPALLAQAQRELETAELNVVEAQIAQKDSTDAVDEAQRLLNETISGASTTSDTYKTALQQLKEAQDAEAESIDKVRDAKEREIETTRNLAKAEILLRKAKGKLTKSQRTAANKLLAQLNTPVTVTAPTPTGSGTVSAASAGVPDFANIDFSAIDFSGFSVGGLATLSQGGIVTRPTFSLIGEGGEPEAVIPLSKLGGMGGGDVYNITINSKIADASLPDVIVGELRKFNRRSGAINIQVA